MADNTFYIKIGAVVDDLEKGMDKATTSVEKFETSTKTVSKTVGDSLDGAKSAANNLKGGLEGVADQVLVVGKAAKISGKAMKSALISTGIGAFVVILGEIVANWDKISEFVGLTNRDLEIQENLLKANRGLLSSQLKLNKEQLKFYEDQNLNTDDLLKTEKKLLEQKAALLVASISNLNARLLEEQSAAREVSLWQKAVGIFSLVKPVGFVDKEEEAELTKTRIAVADLNKEYVKIINLLNGGGGDKPKPIKAPDFEVNQQNLNDSLKARSKELFAGLNIEIPGLKTKTLLESAKIAEEGLANLNTAATFELDKFQERLLDFNLGLEELLSQSSIVGYVTDIAAGIGNAFASGGNAIKAAGGAMLGAIADIMIKYGSLTIAFGIAKEGLKKSVESGPFGGGALAVVAGAALVAAGSAIKAFSSNLASSGGATGSVGGASSSSGGGVTTSYGNTGGGFNNARVVFEIAGDKLIGVLNNTSLGNLRVGDSDQLITTG